MREQQDGRQTGLRADGGPDGGGPVRAGEVRAEQPADPHRDAHREDGDTGDMDPDAHQGARYITGFDLAIPGTDHTVTFIIDPHLGANDWYVTDYHPLPPVNDRIAAFDFDIASGDGDTITFRATIGFPNLGRRLPGDGKGTEDERTGLLHPRGKSRFTFGSGDSVGRADPSKE